MNALFIKSMSGKLFVMWIYVGLYDIYLGKVTRWIWSFRITHNNRDCAPFRHSRLLMHSFLSQQTFGGGGVAD